MSNDEEPSVDDTVDFYWRQGELEWLLWPQQVPIYRSIRNLPKHVDPVVILCARQFGKSVLGALLAIEDCIRNPETTVLVVGPTMDQTVGIVNQSIQVVQRSAPAGLVRRAKAESQWYIGDSELIIGGFDSRIATRKRGRRLHRIYLEELVDANPDDYEEAIRSDLGPALTHSKDASMVYLTTLPKIPDHPFITKTIPDAKLNGSFYSFTIDDNKAITPSQYEACVKRCGGRDTVAFRREYLNEIVRDPTVVVVPSFDKATHVTLFEAPLSTIWMMTMDMGGVKDKTVALLMTYDFLADEDLVWDEMVFEPNTPTSVIVTALRVWDKPYNLEHKVADVPGQTSVDLNQSFGYYIQSPQKSDWQASINQMVARFQLNKVKVHKRCKFLTVSLESGTLNKQKNDFERTQALGHCDALAALMYGLRCINRTNPWANMVPSRDHYIVLPKETIEGEVAKSIQPKSFATNKQFGSFRK